MNKEKYLQFKSPEILMTLLTRSGDSFLQSIHTSIALFLGNKVCKVQDITYETPVKQFIHTTVDGFPVVVPDCFLRELPAELKTDVEKEEELNVNKEFCDKLMECFKNKLQDLITMNTEWVLNTELSYSNSNSTFEKKFFAFKGLLADDFSNVQQIVDFAEARAENVFQELKNYVEENKLVPDNGILVYNIAKIEYLVNKDSLNSLYRGLCFFQQVINDVIK